MKIKLLLLLWCLSLNSFYLTAGEKDSLAIRKANSIEESSSNFVHFPELDKKFPIQKSVHVVSSPEFTFPNLEKEFPTVAAITDSKKEAEAGFKRIDSTDSWISSFGTEDMQSLPVGIKHKLGEVEYQLGITKAKFTKEYTELTAFVKVILPQTKEDGLPIELFFGANNVKLSHQGGIMGDASLVLLGDMFIPFNGGNWLLILKGGFDYKTGDTQNKTFVTINCDGVKEMGIEGEVQFSRSMIVPVDETGKLLPETREYKGALKETIQIPNRVSGTFKAVASDWNDLIVEIGLSPFVLASQPDKFMFSVNQAVFDFSDLRTENVNFPQHYHDNGLLLPSVETWRGVYVQSLKVGLPQEFKTKENIPAKKRVTFEAANLIIDSYGVSGFFSAENLITIDSGRTSESKSWAYSVDKIGIEIASNKLVGAEFEGQVLLPISDKGDKNGTTAEGEDGRMGLGYQGIISEDEYGLVVSTLDTLSFDVFKAKAELLPNSSVELMVVDGNFRPKAVLNGRMAISASQKESLANEGQTYTTGEGENAKKETVQFKGIEFQNLVLQTTSPVISVDYFGYKDEVKLANFPVSIADIAFTSNEYEAGLEFDLMINLMGKESKGFAADARLGIFGKFEEVNYKQRWKYDRLDLSRINIEANMGAIKLKGGLELMDDDPEYGDGFSAEIEGTFGSFGPITCKAIFGRKDFRYWYVDAAVHGLKIQAGPLQISGFAGGAFYRMTKRKGVSASEFSPSGLSYVPSESSSLGVKAMIFGAIGDESAISVGAGFEIEFNRSGGVNRLGFFGEAQVMKAFKFDNPVAKLTDKLGKMADNELVKGVMDSKAGKTFLDKADEEYETEVVGEAAISAKLGMEFDFVNDSFHANLDLYVTVAGGIIQGRASGGRAGWGVIHISPDEWYVHLGTPTDRLGLKMGVGPVSIETGGYFMIGDRIPGSPPPPPEVAEILGVDVAELDYMRDENALGDGRGFAFGSDFKIDTGDINFLIFYARFQAGLGFDIMLKDYGEARCVNTGDQVGINGWYANGQAYAYLQGELGINIKLFFIRKKIPIIKGGAALLLQGKGPNPFWFRGYAGGYFNLLGGLVKGSFRFKLTIGTECELDNASPFDGIKMITDLAPKDGDSNVDVFAAPQAAFAMRVNKPIVIPEDDGDNIYKVILEKFNVVDQSGKEILGKVEWGQMNDRATFISDDILPPDTKLKVTVEVSFQEKVDGVFKTILDDGEKAVEIEERNFTTGQAPTHIPLHNIKYSYPVVDQQLFYPGEYGTGYIQLLRGQDYLFDSSQWKSTVKYVDDTGSIQEADFGYSTSDNKVSYKLPKVGKETKYAISIVSSTKSSGSSSSETKTEKNEYDDDNSIEVTKNEANSVLKEGEIDRLTYEFKSSKYKTFKEKVNSISVSNYDIGKVYSDVIFLSTRAKSYEGFDLVELVGNKYSEGKALVNTEASLIDKYYQDDMRPILYRDYPISNRYSFSRDVNEYGLVPKKALPIMSNYLTSLENDTDTQWRATRFPYRYMLAKVYKHDFDDILRQIYNDYTDGILSQGDSALQFLDNKYKFMRQGKYQIELKYTLPGGINGTKTNYNFKNPVSL